jgi:hypothetical protein
VIHSVPAIQSLNKQSLTLIDLPMGNISQSKYKTSVSVEINCIYVSPTFICETVSSTLVQK